jgi:hypothetical protein
MKSPKTDAQRLVNDTTYAGAKIDKQERKEGIARYEAIRESVKRFLESMLDK